jgi:hypothetical protein
VPSSVWNLPNHRRPRTMGRGSTGSNSAQVFRIRSSAVDQRSLGVRPDPAAPEVHATVEPSAPVRLEQYELHLADTRPDWEG